MAFTTLFTNSSQTAAYASFRPGYPRAVFEAIYRHCQPRETGGFRLAVDVATGSGQALLGLVHDFDKVLGVDVSEKQLEHAPKLSNVDYRVGDAHSLPIESGTADLVTVAQALHWFDRPAFYNEAARVLRPETGVLAAWTYGFGHIQPSGGAVDRVYADIHSDVLGPFWPAPRALVDNRYTTVEPMGPHFEDTAREELTMDSQDSVDSLVGYISSWSAYVQYCRAHPELPEPAEAFKTRLQEAAVQDGSDPARLTRIMPVTILLGKGPKLR